MSVLSVHCIFLIFTMYNIRTILLTKLTCLIHSGNMGVLMMTLYARSASTIRSIHCRPHAVNDSCDYREQIFLSQIDSLYSRVTEAAKKQLDNLWHTTNIYYHPTIHEYAELMASKFPGNLKVDIKGRLFKRSLS